LKVLEGETGESIGRQMVMFRQRALPDLDHNIQCGNSLIGPDFYQGKQANLLDEEEHYRINAFDWEAAFPEVMKANGFDAVIGNPPYIRIQALKEWAPVEVEYYKRRYIAASKGNYDIYVVFAEKGLSLLNQRGRLGFILPHKFFNSQYGAPLRSLIASGKHLSDVVHFGDQQVFAGATTYTCLMFLGKAGSDQCRVEKIADLSQWRIDGQAVHGDIPASRIADTEWNFTIGTGSDLFEKLRAMPVKLGDVAERIFQGLVTVADTVYLFKEYRCLENGMLMEVCSRELGEWVALEAGILKAVVRSGKIHRYDATSSVLMLFPYEVKDCTARLRTSDELRQIYPLACAYLNRNRRCLEEREKSRFKDPQWYRFGRTQNLGLWEQPKLLIPYMVTSLAAYLDHSDNYYFSNVTTGGYGITFDSNFGSLAYCCSLLNSRLLDFYFKRVASTFHGGYYAANKQFIEQLPIRTIDFANPADVTRHDQMVALVERMLVMHRELAAARISQDKMMIQRQIDATDREIDRLVYELYELTDGEIAIVEGKG
jgi:hypothetical protein